MGVATGLAFDTERNLYVGDRSGTIFKIAPDRQIFVFATLEPSVAAYHLAFGPDGTLYVTGPTTSSYDAVYAIKRDGDIGVLHRGLGRPQGIAVDIAGNVYVAASLGGRRGVVCITPHGRGVAGGGRERYCWVQLSFRRAEPCWRPAPRFTIWRWVWKDGGCEAAAGAVALYGESSRGSMNAEIIAVGSEMLTPFRQDTNSLYLTEKLNELGVDVAFKTIVGDRRSIWWMRCGTRWGGSTFCVVSGGLGPTEDDLTREAVAEALGVRVKRDAGPDRAAVCAGGVAAHDDYAQQ